MPDSEPQANVPEPSIVVDGTTTGVIRRGGMVIGSFDANGLVLDLGWCRLAKVDVRLLDDKVNGDNHRGGIAFERLAKGND